MNLYDYCVKKGRMDLVETWNDPTPMENVALWSHKKYRLKCPVCGTERDQYLGGIVNRPDTKLQCVYCNSFGVWCETNNSEWLPLWDDEKNNISPFEINKCVGTSYYFKCARGLHESRLVRIADITFDKMKYQCCLCNSFAQWCIDHNRQDLVDRWDFDKNKKTPDQVSYSSGKKYYFKCPKGLHDSEAKALCNVIKQEGSQKCQGCNSFAQVLIDRFGQDYFDSIWSDKNALNPFKISQKCDHKVWINCCDNKDHPPFLMACHNYSKGERCPICSNESITSKLQNKVAKYINENYSYTLLHEAKCTLKPVNPQTNATLRYDNEIKELKIIIEVMGVQHYKISNLHRKNAERRGMTLEEYFEYSQWLDEFKKQFALNSGFYYLAVPYWTEETEEYKSLIDNAIREQVLKLQTNP